MILVKFGNNRFYSYTQLCPYNNLSDVKPNKYIYNTTKPRISLVRELDKLNISNKEIADIFDWNYNEYSKELYIPTIKFSNVEPNKKLSISIRYWNGKIKCWMTCKEFVDYLRNI